MAYRLLIFFLFGGFFLLVNGQDIVKKTFCWNQDFRLGCKPKNVLAIHEAYFTNDYKEINKSDCRLTPTANNRTEEQCKEDIKNSLNKRCSGLTICRYNMTVDHIQRECYCRGIIVLRYACIPENDIAMSCNSKVIGSSGYITSPGYPRFYPKVSKCNWTLENSIGEELSLEVLDLDTRVPARRKPLPYCPDSLTVFEDFQKLRYTCGLYNNETKRLISSSGKKVHIEFNSLDFMPNRGFLLYYKVLGCVTLPPPKLGYLVHRNKNIASYMCCKDHVFNNTRSNTLFLQCINEMRWNGTVAPCVSLELPNITNIIDEVKVDSIDLQFARKKYIEDVLIPTACIVGLTFGIVAALILICRKKRKMSSTNHLTSRMLPPPPQSPFPPPLPPLKSSLPPPPSPPLIQKPPTVSTVPMAPRVLITDL